MRPMFADPKTDFAFKKIFGDTTQPEPLKGLLNGLLELDAAHHIVHLDVLQTWAQRAVAAETPAKIGGEA